MKITSPSTDAEIAVALRVLEGCCLLHHESGVLAHQYKAIPVRSRQSTNNFHALTIPSLYMRYMVIRGNSANGDHFQLPKFLDLCII